MTDPIADLITKIKNAGIIGKETVVVPYSKLKESILTALQKNGYINSFSTKGKKVIKSIEVTLSYEQKAPRVQSVRRISRPSRRVYVKASEIRPVRQGFGSLFISTPKGILTDKEARKEKVGGEVLFEIW